MFVQVVNVSAPPIYELHFVTLFLNLQQHVAGPLQALRSGKTSQISVQAPGIFKVIEL